MTLKFTWSISLFLVLTFGLFAQTDTLTFMTYNLMRYGAPGISCTPVDTSIRKGYLRTIVDYVKPDVWGVNEIGNNAAVADYILSQVLNRNGKTYARVALSASETTSDIINMHYYNTAKLGLKAQDNITTTTRHVKVTQLYYKDPNFPQTTDTTFLILLQAHLKAGNTTSDATTRNNESVAITNYLSYYGFAANFVIMGDFNLYTSTESAYTNLTNNFNRAIRFLDPVNRPGAWSNNNSFADVHTQSPGTSSANCLSGGGMDDRFDFILATSIIAGTTTGNAFRYIPGTYKAVGNDGARFNASINNAANTSAPSQVLSALVANSDHVPVTAKFSIRRGVITGTNAQEIPQGLSIWQDITNGLESLWLSNRFDTWNGTCEVYNASGQQMQSKEVTLQKGVTVLEGSNLWPAGVYLIHLYNQNQKLVLKWTK